MMQWLPQSLRVATRDPLSLRARRLSASALTTSTPSSCSCATLMRWRWEALSPWTPEESRPRRMQDLSASAASGPDLARAAATELQCRLRAANFLREARLAGKSTTSGRTRAFPRTHAAAVARMTIKNLRRGKEHLKENKAAEADPRAKAKVSGDGCWRR